LKLSKINHCSRVSSKVSGSIAAITDGVMPFLTATSENRRAHGLVACEIAPIMAFLLG
jgi:hypothetical protein